MEKTDQAQLSAQQKVNRFIMILIVVMDVFIAAGYVMDILNGSIGTVFGLIVIGLIAISLIVNVRTYKVNPDAFKYVTIMGYAVIYGAGLFGSSSDFLFVIIMPITVSFVLYYDLKLVNAMAVAFTTINILDVLNIVLRLKAMHSGNPVDATAMFVQVASVTIYFIALRFITGISITNNENKIAQIQSMSDNIMNSIDDINLRLMGLSKASEAMTTSMNEINVGTNDTAAAVQGQLTQTSEIQNKIELVQNETADMTAHLAEAIESVRSGNKSIEVLVSGSDRSVEISKLVKEKLTVLQGNMEAMNKITKLIDGITFQTNIMALNANVEAAHAGEAGRGFAVVAQEISGMADKTKKATADINEMIANVAAALAEVESAVGDMASVIRQEKANTAVAADNFNAIDNKTSEMLAIAGMLKDNIDDLTYSNRQIVAAVEKISATTEEVTAITNETLNIETRNLNDLKEVANMVSELANV